MLPIFVASCSFGECHGSTSGHSDNNGVFLGAKAAANDAKASRSFLFRNLEGDMCGLSECSGAGAGSALSSEGGCG